MTRKEKRGYKTNKKLTDNIVIRVDSQTKKELEESTKTLKTTRSDIVRRGITLVYSNL